MFKSKRVLWTNSENVFGDRYNLHSVVEHDVKKSTLKPFEQFLHNFIFIFLRGLYNTSTLAQIFVKLFNCLKVDWKIVRYFLKSVFKARSASETLILTVRMRIRGTCK